jgi:beta-phosphoglucomutase-like phosphatase (HAD superfamily)
MGGTGDTEILSGIRLLIFDFDGVIVDSEPLHFAKFAEVLADDGVTLTWEEYKDKYLAYNDRDCFEHVLVDKGWEPHPLSPSPTWRGGTAKDRGVRSFDEEYLSRLVARKAAAFDREMKTGLKPVPGTAEFIKRAAPHYLLAIASGALRHEIEEILERHGLRGFFPVIVGAEDAPRGKPNPDPFLRALELTNDLLARDSGAPAPPRPTAYRLPPVVPSECLVIEDSPLGIEGAKAAGMQTLALTTSYPSKNLAHAGHVLGSLKEARIPPKTRPKPARASARR